MEKVVVRYYRKGGKLRGCVIGVIKENGLIRLGWSLYHKSLEKEAGIPFTKKVAREWALARAVDMPQSLYDTAKKVNEHCGNIIIKNMDGGNNNARENVTSDDKG